MTAARRNVPASSPSRTTGWAGRGQLFRAVAGVGLLGAIGTGVAMLLDAGVPVPLWFGLAAVIVAGYHLAGRIAVSERVGPMVREDSDSRVYAMPDRPFAAMRAIEERLELVRGDADYFRRTVLPTLTALVEDRLRLAYGIDPDGEPERARALLGQRLAEFLYAEPGPGRERPPSGSELATIVTEMERLWTNQR